MPNESSNSCLFFEKIYLTLQDLDYINPINYQKKYSDKKIPYILPGAKNFHNKILQK